MNYKKKIILISSFLIISIQILLLVNNKQKTSFRYLIWDNKDVSIGRLIFVSFISGLMVSSILNKTKVNNDKIYAEREENDKTNFDNDYSINNYKNDESYEIPPERDLRDSQPTISVNYRVIKNNGESVLKNKNQNLGNSQNHDDWGNNESDW